MIFGSRTFLSFSITFLILTPLVSQDKHCFIRENAPFSDENVTISFGCKVLLDDSIRNMASQFVELVGRRQFQRASSAYLELMLAVRRELAYELDQAKFNSLNMSDLVVFFRNVVYAKLRSYKAETKQALTMLSDRLNCDAKLRERLQSLVLNSEYGITDESARVIDELLSIDPYLKEKGE